MTNSEQAIREKAINIFADIFAAGGESHEVGGQSFDQLQQSGYIDRKVTDLISEHYVAKEEVEKVVSERLREELMRYDQWLLANDMGQMFDDTMKCVDEYLKSR